jgi:hypothetical protein
MDVWAERDQEAKPRDVRVPAGPDIALDLLGTPIANDTRVQLVHLLRDARNSSA